MELHKEKDKLLTERQRQAVLLSHAAKENETGEIQIFKIMCHVSVPEN